MMTTNLFVIANVKQLWTYVVLEIYCLFFRTSWCVGVINSAIFNSFHNRVEFGTILEGLQNFGGGFEHPKPPLGPPLLQTFLSWRACLNTYDVLAFHQLGNLVKAMLLRDADFSSTRLRGYVRRLRSSTHLIHHHWKATGQGFPQDAASCGAHTRHVTRIPITLLSLGAGVLAGWTLLVRRHRRSGLWLRGKSR